MNAPTPATPAVEQTEQRLRQLQQRRKFNFLAPPACTDSPPRKDGVVAKARK